ncbi:uncharacterized protein LOC143518571 [Brachyhypopomus gauderio]|uniref:uncharacterized protein LOC143518571 n=1 Tax=Brachyhypopomus gauderio TaxID=698409 RepID=UPI004043128D
MCRKKTVAKTVVKFGDLVTCGSSGLIRRVCTACKHAPESAFAPLPGTVGAAVPVLHACHASCAMSRYQTHLLNVGLVCSVWCESQRVNRTSGILRCGALECPLGGALLWLI